MHNYLKIKINPKEGIKYKEIKYKYQTQIENRNSHKTLLTQL
jgi:hypothetical protein